MIVKRTNQEVIYKSFHSSFITALLGPRRVGKTTLVKEFAKQQSEAAWIFLNMDQLDLNRRIEQGNLRRHIEEQAEQRIGGENKLWIAIDEAQKCPLIFDQIKLIYDEFKDQNAIKFIITGSGLLDLHQLSAESLAGRIQIHYLHGFGLKEATALLKPTKLLDGSILETIFAQRDMEQFSAIVDQLAPLRLKLIEALQTLLLWGSLPEALQLDSDDERLIYLADYLQTYLEKDIRAIKTITDLNLYRKLIEIIAQQTGSIREDKRIIDALGCNRDTLKKYRGFLEATLLYREVYPFIDSPLKRLVKSPKGYLLDNGLITYLSDIISLSILEKTGLIGARFENWFLNELQIVIDRSPRRSNIYFWRTSSGAEVDFIVQKGDKIFPFEVTYGHRTERSKIRNLRTFMQAERVQTGFYIYNGEYRFDPDLGICFLPAWAI